jgi:hypothetical protein
LSRSRLAALLLVLAAPRLGAEPPAELVLRGAAVYTQDAARSRAEAVAVSGGRIAFVGSAAAAAAWIGPGTRVVSLESGMLLPGFQDAHVHPSSGYELLQCDLNDLPATSEAVTAKVSECAEAPGEWIVGSGWELPAFPPAGPRREDLDAVVGDRPAYLAAADEHSAWVSSAALRKAGSTAATPDPRDGRIERDPATGEPTGTLREKAMELVQRLVPPPTREQRVEGLALALARLNAAGVTSALEAKARPVDLESYRELRDQGRLSVRIAAALLVDTERGPEQIPGLERLRDAYASDRLRIGAAKIFIDGVIESRTAAMLEPYADREGEAGTPRVTAEHLGALVEALAKAGFGFHGHAIGDRAVRMGLDAVEAAGPAARRSPLRHLLAHVQVIHPDDVPRFRRLDVVACFQPLWAYADSYITELTWPGLGPERSRWIYPIASVAAAGAPLAFGSDWTVSSLEPLLGLQVAVTRRDPREPGEVMQPQQVIDLPTALAAYTIGAAWALGHERETGSIEVGKRADLVLLERDLFEVAPEAIGAVAVRATLLDGKPVFLADDLAWPVAPAAVETEGDPAPASR